MAEMLPEGENTHHQHCWKVGTVTTNKPTSYQYVDLSELPSHRTILWPLWNTTPAAFNNGATCATGPGGRVFPSFKKAHPTEHADWESQSWRERRPWGHGFATGEPAEAMHSGPSTATLQFLFHEWHQKKSTLHLGLSKAWNTSAFG